MHLITQSTKDAANGYGFPEIHNGSIHSADTEHYEVKSHHTICQSTVKYSHVLGESSIKLRLAL